MNRPCRSTVLNSLAAMLLSLSFGQQIFTPSASAQSADHFDPSPAAVPELGDGMSRNIVACSADGKFFVLATPDGRLKYTRTADGVTLRTFYHCHPRAAAFSPDGHLLITAGAAQGHPGKIKVWRLPEGALVCQWEAEVTDQLQLRVSPDGLVLAGNGSDAQLHLWRLPEGTPKRSVPLPRAISQIAFTDEGRSVVAIGLNGSITFWEAP